MQGAIAFIKRAHRTRNGIDGPLQMGTGRPHVEQLRRHPHLAPARDLDPVRLDALTGSARKVAHFGSWPSMAR